jgi:hypothetical protein
MQVDEEFGHHISHGNITTTRTASGEDCDLDSHDSESEGRNTPSVAKGGKLWDPLIGFSDREMEEWEQEGEYKSSIFAT